MESFRRIKRAGRRSGVVVVVEEVIVAGVVGVVGIEILVVVLGALGVYRCRNRCRSLSRSTNISSCNSQVYRNASRIRRRSISRNSRSSINVNG